jgi:hypothetical protein
MQTQSNSIELESLDRSMLIELATIKGLEFPKNIKTTKLIELLKQ